MLLSLGKIVFIADAQGVGGCESSFEFEPDAVIEPSATAIIAIDVWKRDYLVEPYNTISANLIGPLLEVSRQQGVVIIYALHRPIGWDGVNSSYNGDSDPVQGVADGVLLVDRPGEYFQSNVNTVQYILEQHQIQRVACVGYWTD